MYASCLTFAHLLKLYAYVEKGLQKVNIQTRHKKGKIFFEVYMGKGGRGVFFRKKKYVANKSEAEV